MRNGSGLNKGVVLEVGRSRQLGYVLEINRPINAPKTGAQGTQHLEV